MKLKIKKLIDDAVVPKYAKDGDAALDLYSIEEHILKPGDRKSVSTGIAMEIPKGNVGLIWDKSGLAAKNGVHVMAGVVDSGYRGEIKVIIKNLGDENFVIEKNSKIAQMIIQPFLSAQVEEVKELSESERGEKGFGSTGLK